jgi:hypothetical protein
MPPWLRDLIPVVVPVLAVMVNAVISMKIRFAPDEATAARELKGLASRIIQWILNAGIVALLVYELFSSEPLTRLAVFEIALQVGVLTLIVVLFVINRFANLLKLSIESQVRTIESQVHHNRNP